MSRKDYELIARVINQQLQYALETDKSGVFFSLHTLAVALTIEFKQDNARFDADKFMSACGF